MARPDGPSSRRREGFPQPKRPFPFPYDKPYEIQSRFMAELYGTIKTRRVGIFESPTGTVRSPSPSARSFDESFVYRMFDSNRPTH